MCQSKVCPECERELSLDSFRLRKTGIPYAYCDPCQNKRSREAYHNRKIENPEAHRARQLKGYEWKRNHTTTYSKNYSRNSYLKKKYGITLNDYEEILKSQNRVCAVCQEFCNSGRALAVDHCHISGKIRGLLCINCNQGLGKFKDSIKLLDKAIDYLKD